MKELWSVEMEASSWSDDLFNGSYDECVEYCKNHDIKIDGIEARLAKILVDEKGIVLEVTEIVEDIDFEE